MLDDAVAAYLDSVSERAFDEPLLALLRARDYTDVHLVHGQREFGKDVIAKRDGAQWAWQSKTGDINQGDWRELDGQLDELRRVNLGHGSFDADLPRRTVLVTTGRLVGNAPDLFRDHNDRARKGDEAELELWDRDTLLGYLSGEPQAVLRGSMDGKILAALGSVDEQTATMASLEEFSRRWTVWDLKRLTGQGVIEAALLCERLKNAERIDLACHTALCLVRGAWAASGDTGLAPSAADAAGRLFESYALQLWDECDERLLREKGLVGFSGASAWVTYPVRCTRIIKILGLLAIRLQHSEAKLSPEIARWLVDFTRAQPGSAHPISDMYAVSLIPAVLAVISVDRDAALKLLRQTTVWVADAYQPGHFGLASAHASATEEIERVLGNSLEAIDHPRRPMSLIATVILDLCTALSATDLYADVYNDVRAVGAYPLVIRLDSGRDQYLRDGPANRLDPNVDFASELEDGRTAAPHHLDVAGRELCDRGREWDLLAISAALRDRYFFQALASLARQEQPQS